MLQIQFGVAKVNKYASRESGDTVELVERPTGPGGLTAVLVDGQGSGRSAKALSNFVAEHCVTLLKQGVRDGVVARAANDRLYAHKFGQVSATLNLLTIDLATQSLVITRNNPEPAYIWGIGVGGQESEIEAQEEILNPPFQLVSLDASSVALGLYPRTRPVINEVELKDGLIAVVFSDGLSSAGQRYEVRVDLPKFLKERLTAPDAPRDAQALANELLELALTADHRRPQDDMSVIVLTVQAIAAEDGPPLPRRMSVQVVVSGQ